MVTFSEREKEAVRKIEGGVNVSASASGASGAAKGGGPKKKSLRNGGKGDEPVDITALTLKEQQEYRLENLQERVKMTEVVEKVLVIHFVKHDPGLPWARVCKGHPEIDVRTLKFNDNLYFTLANESL